MSFSLRAWNSRRLPCRERTPRISPRGAEVHDCFLVVVDSDSPNLSGAEWLGLARSGAGRHGGRPCRRPPSLRELAASRAPLHQERPDDYRASFSIFVPSGCAGTCVATSASTFPASTLQTSHGALAHVRYHSFARQSQKKKPHHSRFLARALFLSMFELCGSNTDTVRFSSTSTKVSSNDPVRTENM